MEESKNDSSSYFVTPQSGVMEEIMKKKVLKIIAGMVALLLIALILYVTNSFVGNPISKILVKHSVDKYVTENYSDLDLELNKPQYNFKDGGYYVQAKSKTSIDTHFSIVCNGNGRIRYDDYETYVLGKFNTWCRLNDEYKELIDEVIEKEFPYESDIAFGEIIEKGNDFSGLEIDMKVDISEYAKNVGKLVIYSDSETITEDVLAERLLKIKEIFDRNNVKFYSIDCVVQTPLKEDKKGRDSISVRSFLYQDIYEDGLLDRVMKNVKETEEYYKEMDEKKDMQRDN